MAIQLVSPLMINPLYTFNYSFYFASLRLPKWLKTDIPHGKQISKMTNDLRGLKLHTVSWMQWNSHSFYTAPLRIDPVGFKILSIHPSTPWLVIVKFPFPGLVHITMIHLLPLGVSIASLLSFQLIPVMMLLLIEVLRKGSAGPTVKCAY